MSTPFIPELSLEAVETGGGWGVGEKFARLPPASVQAESRLPMYTLAPERGGVHNAIDSDEESSIQEGGSTVIAEATAVPANTAAVGKREAVPTTQYTTNSIEDDNTFVDHGSSILPATTPNNAHEGNNPSDNALQLKKNREPMPYRKLSGPVSRMLVGQPVRAVVVAPDAGSLLVAVGDDEVAIMDFKGVELNISRTIHATHVYAMAVVHVPAAKSVKFKSGPLTTVNESRTSGSITRPGTTSEGQESCLLWCGVARGNIVIVDLSDYTSSGVIRNAHGQTITGLWYLGNSKVWTTGYDKALKVWDTQTRRHTKSRNIATIISDLCYVRNYKQVWGISDDALIRVFDSSGNNARVAKQSPDKPENTLRMKSEMRFIKYYEPGKVVYVALTRGLLAIDPATCDILVNISVTLTSMEFLDDKALVTGYGELLQCTTEAIGLIDISDPLVPSLLFRGVALEGSVSSVGMRLLTALPLAVTVQETGRSEQYLTVFNYEDSKEFGKGGGLAYIPQQRKVMLEGPSTRRTGVVPQHNVVTPFPASNATTVVTTTAATSLAHNSVVFATDKRGGMMREDSNLSNPPQHRISVVAASRVGSSSTSNKSRDINSSAIFSSMEKSTPVQLVPPPGLMESLSSIEKKTDDLKGLFSQARISRQLLDDFSKLHLFVSQMAMNNELGPTLSADRMASIEKEYQSLEGRLIATAVERLRHNAASALIPTATTTAASIHHTTATSSGAVIPSAPSSTFIQDNNKRRAGVISSTDLERQADCGKEDSINNSNGSIMDEAVTIDSIDVSPGSLLRWVAQISRSGQGERESHRRQLESLQRHNARIVERNTAFINGIARMEQAIRTHAQRLVEEADVAAVMSSEGGSDSSNQNCFYRHIHLINQTIEEIEQVSVSSSPKKITECIGVLTSLVSRLLSAQQYIQNDGSTKRIAGDFSPSYTAVDQNSDTGRLFLNNGNSMQNSMQMGRPQSPIPSALLVFPAHPQRILSIIEGQLSSAEDFLKDVGRFWCCLEETQKVIYQPYEGGAKPDLLWDFMQFAVLWHLREAQVMVDVCRNEAILVMAETLLSDLECQENSVERGMGGSTHGVKSSTSAAGVVGTAKKTAMGSVDFAETIRNDSARLVGLGIELESVASGIRESLKMAGQSLPKGIAKEAVGGLFLIPSEKLHVDDTRLRGMLHWERVTMHLIFEGLECLEDLLFHSDEQPRLFRKDNFKALEQQIDDWRLFLEDVQSETAQLRSVILSSYPTGSSTGADTPTPQNHHHHHSSNHHHHHHHTCTTTTTATNTHSQHRQDATSSEAYSRLPSTDVGPCADAVDVLWSRPWVVLFGLFVHLAARPRPPSLPSLFAAPDASDFGLMTSFDDVAEAAETVRARSAALLLYCRKLQSRLRRVVEEAVVHEETGLVHIPTWCGGTIAERYCKGFCHDLC